MKKKLPRAFTSLFKFLKKKTVVLNVCAPFLRYSALFAVSQEDLPIMASEGNSGSRGWGLGWGGWRQMGRVVSIHAAPTWGLHQNYNPA